MSAVEQQKTKAFCELTSLTWSFLAAVCQPFADGRVSQEVCGV